VGSHRGGHVYADGLPVLHEPGLRHSGLRVRALS
jgi:hypothetical protein